MPQDPADVALRADAYARLRQTAERFLAAERVDHTLQPTALVHEAWLRLANWRSQQSLSETDYHGLASHVMRRVLTDHARRRTAAKRDARREQDVADMELVERTGPTVVLEVDAALRELADVDAELAELVELRFFGGHTLAEIAELRGQSLSTVNRRWKLARAWLLDALGDDSETMPAARSAASRPPRGSS